MSDTINTNMEGTRNERVAILIASYVIGFVTAYIAFGVIQLENSVQFAQVSSQYTASVINSQNKTNTTSGNTYLAMDKEGLILIVDNERTLLSITDNSDGFLGDGAHVAISEYALSSDKKNVYFCELPSEDSESCRPYIYSVTDDTVYPVTVDGQRVAFKADGQEVSWSKDGELLVN